MEFTRIAGKQVSRIGLGTWALGGLDWGVVPEGVAVATLLRAVDLGINLIDTAPIYGRGRAEELIGKAIRQRGRRDDFYIATKAGLDWEAGQPKPGVYANSTEPRLRRELEDSLRRLGTDFIDLYQVHWPDTIVPIAETAGLLGEFVREGKVGAVGVSNFSVAQMEEFRSVTPLASDQPPYNLFEREIDAEVLPWCARNEVAILTYSSLCRSLLGGRLTRDTTFDDGDIRRVDPKFQRPRFSQYMDAVGQLTAFAQERYGKTILEFAVRWVLDQPGVSVALWGAKRPEQLDAVAGVMGWTIDSGAIVEVDRIIAECVTDPAGPEYLAPGVRSN